MEMYQHDSPARFEFVLRGDLTGEPITDLEHAWNTAKSILGDRVLVVDISGVKMADAHAIALLSRMRESGAYLTGALPPDSPAAALRVNR
jgi:ABC-type transporter Mla MlaB component